jgi:hypothetical protein
MDMWDSANVLVSDAQTKSLLMVSELETSVWFEPPNAKNRAQQMRPIVARLYPSAEIKLINTSNFADRLM